jgi:hypothetical protein
MTTKIAQTVAQPIFSRLKFLQKNSPVAKKFRPKCEILPNLVTLTFVESDIIFIQSFLFLRPGYRLMSLAE